MFEMKAVAWVHPFRGDDYALDIMAKSLPNEKSMAFITWSVKHVIKALKKQRSAIFTDWHIEINGRSLTPDKEGVKRIMREHAKRGRWGFDPTDGYCEY